MFETEIVVDAGIPDAERAFGHFGQVRTVKAEEITVETLDMAEILVVRSVTAVDSELLGGSSVRFVGSATAGTDHVDIDWLNRAGITFAHAPGANASSVADYVIAGLLRSAVATGERLAGRVLGIVGCGRIGERVAQRADALGMKLLRNDPPRAESEGAAGFVSLDELLSRSEAVTLHVPLEKDAAHPTHHLIGDRELEALSDGCWLFNTSRGPVTDNEALLRHSERLLLHLDVWENEPLPMRDLVGRSALATAHVAGYATDAKRLANEMISRALARWFAGRASHDGGSNSDSFAESSEGTGIGGAESSRVNGGASTSESSGASRDEPGVTLAMPAGSDLTVLSALAAAACPLDRDDRLLRTSLAAPDRGAAFEDLRKSYPGRRLMAVHTVQAAAVSSERSSERASALETMIARGLGMIVDPRTP